MPADRDLFDSQVSREDRESTTFCQDFLIAERYGGVNAIKDTFNRAFSSWKSHFKYLTELAMTLNHLLALHYTNDGADDERTNLYNELWQMTFDWGRANLKGDELLFFNSVLD